MPGLMGAIEQMRATFDKYAGSDRTMCKKELATMLKTELPGVTGDKQSEVEEFFKMLDGDGDGVVDFKEFIIFVATIAMLLG